MTNEIQNYDDSFETNIFKHINEGQTGTILIATKNNKSCQVTIKEGEIVAVSMGRFKGYEAATELSKGGIKRAAFNKNMTFPHTAAALIKSTETFTNKLKSVNDIVASEDLSASNDVDNNEQEVAAA